MGLLPEGKNDPIVTDFGANTRAEWEAQNERAFAATEAAQKKLARNKKKKKFAKAKRPTAKEKKLAASAAPGITRMIEQQKKRGLSGLDGGKSLQRHGIRLP